MTFWFPKFASLISQMTFWFPKFVRLISQMSFWFLKFAGLISKISFWFSKFVSYKMGLEGLRDDCLLHVFVRRALSRSLEQSCFLCFCSWLSLEDFYLVTEMSRCNLGVTVFKTLIARSYLINFLITGGFLRLAWTVCNSQLNLTSDRLLSDNVISMPFSAYYVRWNHGLACTYWHTQPRSR